MQPPSSSAGNRGGRADDDDAFWEAVVHSTPALQQQPQQQQQQSRPAARQFSSSSSRPPFSSARPVPILPGAATVASFFPDDFDAAFRQSAPQPPPYRPPSPQPAAASASAAQKRPLQQPASTGSPAAKRPQPSAPPASPSLCAGHGLPMRELTTRKPGPNCGRSFRTCAQSPQCSSFEWTTQTAASSFSASSATASSSASSAASTQPLPAPAVPASSLPRSACLVCRFEVVAGDSFSLSFSPFSSVLISLLKRCNGRYNADSKAWTFPLDGYDDLLAELKAASSPSSSSSSPPLQLDLSDEIPKTIRKFLSKKPPAAPAIPDSAIRQSLPPVLGAALLPFQLDGVRFALSKGGRAHIADEMGVGKSVQAIAVMSWYSEDWPVLIVCPSSLRLNWKTEILKWYTLQPDADSAACSSCDICASHPLLSAVLSSAPRWKKGDEGDAEAEEGDDDSADGDSDDDSESGIGSCIDIIFSASDRRLIERRLAAGSRRFITIVSYALVSALRPVLESAEYGLSIGDESHLIKSHMAKRTRALLPILKQSKRCLLLSGTPALNRPAELFTQLHALCPALFTSFPAFGNRYCAPTQTAWGKVYQGGEHLSELHLLLTRFVMIRRMKADVLPQLPPKRRQAVIVDCPTALLKKQGDSIAGIEDSIRQIISDDTAASSGEQRDPQKLCTPRAVRAEVMRLFTLTAEAKAPVVVQYCVELLESLDKFLVFFHHQSLADALSSALSSHSIAFVRIDGSTPASQRQQAVDTFQSSPAHRIALLSITAASNGFTLTAASTVIFAELFWSPAWLLQAEDRVHRIGSTASSVNIQYILARLSIDELMWPLLTRKLDLLTQALNGVKADGRDGGMNIDAVHSKAADAGRGAQQTDIRSSMQPVTAQPQPQRQQQLQPEEQLPYVAAENAEVARLVEDSTSLESEALLERSIESRTREFESMSVHSAFYHTLALLDVISGAASEHLSLWSQDAAKEVLNSVAIAIQQGNTMSILVAHAAALLRAA